MPQFHFINFFSSQLKLGIGEADTSIDIGVDSAELLPELPAENEIRLTLWDGQQSPEIVAATTNDLTGIITVVRGKEGTTAKAWGAGTQVICTLTAEIVNAALAAYWDINAALGDTFMPKAGGTFSGPPIWATSPTLSGHLANKGYIDLLVAERLSRGGGTMLGAINMGLNKITNMALGVADNDAATVKNIIDALAAFEPDFEDVPAHVHVIGDTTGLVTALDARLVLANNFSDVPNKPLARSNLGVSEVLVGSIVDYPGIRLPSKYLWANGAAVSRVTYATLYEVLTATSTANITSGSAILGAVPESFVGLGLEGAPIEGTGIPAGATIVSVTSNSITISANATVSGTGVAIRILPYGVGNGTTTFNIPDRRGRVGAGRDNMGGTSANRVTKPDAYTINGINGDILGASGGHEVHQITTAQLASHAHPGVNRGGSGASDQTDSGSRWNYIVPPTLNTSTDSVGSDDPHNNMQPTQITNAIIYTGV